MWLSLPQRVIDIPIRTLISYSWRPSVVNTLSRYPNLNTLLISLPSQRILDRSSCCDSSLRSLTALSVRQTLKDFAVSAVVSFCRGILLNEFSRRAPTCMSSRTLDSGTDSCGHTSCFDLKLLDDFWVQICVGIPRIVLFLFLMRIVFQRMRYSRAQGGTLQVKILSTSNSLSHSQRPACTSMSRLVRK